jgi:hypothetical protein
VINILPPPKSREEVNRALDAAAALIPEGTPLIPDEALRRENLYTREDDWNHH